MKEWCEKSIDFENAAGIVLSQNGYARSKGIPTSTFSKHVKRYHAQKEGGDNIKKKKGQGKPSIIDEQNQLLIVEYIIRMDRANQPLSKNQIITFMMELFPNRSRKQCINCLDRTIRTRFHDKLSNLKKAQKTTLKRNAITISQQYRWHKVF